MPWTEISAIAAVAAAIIAFIGAIIGRLNYADSELERQNRIDNRVGSWVKRVEYEEFESSGSGLIDAVGFGSNPHYDFEVSNILVTEDSGLTYLLKKIVWGFDGAVEIDIRSRQYSIAAEGFISETPADFDYIEEFSFGDYDVDEMLDPEDALIRLRFPNAGIDEIERTIEDLMDFIGENLGTIPPVSYEEMQDQA